MFRPLILIAMVSCTAPAPPPAARHLASVEAAYTELADALRWHEGADSPDPSVDRPTPVSVDAIRTGADSLLDVVERHPVPPADSLGAADRDGLVVRLRALGARAALLAGEGLTLEEARALQDEMPRDPVLVPDDRRVPAATPATAGASVMPPDAGAPTAIGATTMVMPVVGIAPSSLVDTYSQARAAGRAHNAIDIMAPRGSSVVAATSGRVLRRFTSERGGLTLYQLGSDGRTVYYYAHLDGYASGVTDGTILRPGTLIGYVGDTGNAAPGNYHLHFAIWTTDDPKRYWDGESINPYPLLQHAIPAR